MSRRNLFGVGAVVLVAAALWFAWPAGQSASKASEKAAENADDPIAQLRKSRQARGDFDVSPASVKGIVLDGKGAALPGAVVMLKSREGLNAFDMDSTATPATTTSDDEGRWSFSSVSAGKIRITASAKGHYPKAPLDLYLDSGEEREGVEIVLKAGGHALSGTVSDVGGGPVASAVVVVLRSAGFDNKIYSVARTDDAGHYELQLETGGYSVSVTHSDYVRKTDSVHLAADQVLNLSLSPAAAVYGRVLTSDGKPVPGAKVHASGGVGAGDNMGQEAPSAMVDTNDKGEFVMRGLRSGGYRIKAAAKGYSSLTATEIELGIAESLTGVEVIVEPAWTVSGFVVEHSNPKQGIKGVQVMAMDLRTQTFAFSFHPTGDDGYFEIPGVLPGGYMVVAYHEDLLGSFMEVNLKVVDKNIDDVLIKLKRGAVLRGRVAPPTVAEISLEVEDVGFTNMMDAMKAQASKSRSNEDGTFELKPTPSGDYLLVATTKDGRRGEIDVTITQDNQEGLVVTLDEGLSLSGKVVDEKGKPVIAVRVMARLKGDGPRMMMRMGDGEAGMPVNNEGAFRIRGLQEGTYQVEVLDSRGRLTWAGLEGRAMYAPIDIEIGSSDVEGETLKVKRADGVIRGLVLDVDGTPLVDAWVSASRGHPDSILAMSESLEDKPGEKKLTSAEEEERKEALEEAVDEGNYNPYSWGEQEEPVLTDDQGRFALRNLREGSYQVTANAPAGGARAREQGVSPGANVTLRLEKMTDLRVVVNFQGAPVPSYHLSLSGPSSRTHEVKSATGEKVLTRLEKGRYTVAVSTEEASITERVTVGDEPEVRVSLSLQAWCGVRGQLVDLQSRAPLPGLIIWSMSGGDSTDMQQQGMDMMTGKGPRTDENGEFEIGKLYCAKGSLSFMNAASMFGGSGGGRHMSFDLESGTKDLGKIYYDSREPAPDAERGSFGLGLMYIESKETTVSFLHPGGPADLAGIAMGNKVTAVDGIQTEDLAELLYGLADGPNVRIGDVMVFTIVSATGESREVSLTAIAHIADPTEPAVPTP